MTSTLQKLYRKSADDVWLTVEHVGTHALQSDYEAICSFKVTIGVANKPLASDTVYTLSNNTLSVIKNNLKFEYLMHAFAYSDIELDRYGLAYLYRHVKGSDGQPKLVKDSGPSVIIQP